MCKDMLNLITKHLIPKAKKAQQGESEVFYLKLQGDYFRYVAEVGEGERLEKATEIVKRWKRLSVSQPHA